MGQKRRNALRPPERPVAELVPAMRERIERDVRVGVRTPDAMIAAAVERVAYDPDQRARLRPEAERLLAEALAARAEEMEAWPAVTDCDRLNAAFAELEAGGILARQNFACCCTCGVYEMRPLVAAAGARGYVYFHMQDLDHVLDGHGLLLHWGMPPAEPWAREAMASEIVETLRRHGLRAGDDEHARGAVFVRMDWDRRPGTPAPGWAPNG